MIQALKYILMYFDFYDKPYEFKLNYSRPNGTIFGGLASIFTFSMFLLYFLALLF